MAPLPLQVFQYGFGNFIALSFWKTKLNQQKNFCLTESWLIVPTYRETRKIPRISKLWLWIESLYKVVIKIPKSDYNHNFLSKIAIVMGAYVIEF